MTVISTDAASPASDSTALRRCVGAFVTGVTVITALGADGQAEGITANSFSSLSLDPPLIVWSLRLSSRSFNTYKNAARFAVNILAEDQVDISNRFASSGVDRFEGVTYKPGLGGVPLIDGCVSYLECSLEASYPGGDHVLFVGRVERIHTYEGRPLAYGSGGYLSVQPLAV
jgi:flavin reductase (DIM6/NTAB) family NADH-FMN oxidoreductase RutF